MKFVSNKSSKLRKLSFGNNLSEKRLDEFAQTHFLQLKTPIAPRDWIKLTGITYMKKDLRPSWKQLVNNKNKIGRVNILLLHIYILLQIDKSRNETHLMINTTKNIIKSTVEYMIPSDFNFFFRTFRFSIQN